MSKVENPPAFPFADEEIDRDGNVMVTSYSGMTLRDWFAGQALTGIIASPSYGGDGPLTVRAAYLMADAMLAARQQGGAA